MSNKPIGAYIRQYEVSPEVAAIIKNRIKKLMEFGLLKETTLNDICMWCYLQGGVDVMDGLLK